MKTPIFRLARHSVAYLLGTFLIGWGLWCFGYELLYPAQVAAESQAANKELVLFAPNMFSGVIICWGIVLFLTPRFDYRSGILILFGSIIAGCALIGFAYWLGDVWIGWVKAENFASTIMMLALFFFLGSGCAVAGVMRLRHKRNGTPSDKSLPETTPIPGG